MNSYDPYYSQELYNYPEALENVYNSYEVYDSNLEDPFRPQNQLQFPQQGMLESPPQYILPGPMHGGTHTPPPQGPMHGGGYTPPPQGPMHGGGYTPPPQGPMHGGGYTPPPQGPMHGGGYTPPPQGPMHGGMHTPPPQGPMHGGTHTPPPPGPSHGGMHTPPPGPPHDGMHTPPHLGGAPTAPPPLFVPQLTTVPVTAIHAPSMRRCLYRNTYVWLMNGRRFWFYPTYVGATSVAGYRWSESRKRWAYFGIDASEIRSFQCF